MTAEGLLTACLLDLSDCGLALSCGLWSCFDHGPLFGRLCSCWGLYVVVVGLVWCDVVVGALFLGGFQCLVAGECGCGRRGLASGYICRTLEGGVAVDDGLELVL